MLIFVQTMKSLPVLTIISLRFEMFHLILSTEVNQRQKFKLLNVMIIIMPLKIVQRFKIILAKAL